MTECWICKKPFTPTTINPRNKQFYQSHDDCRAAYYNSRKAAIPTLTAAEYEQMQSDTGVGVYELRANYNTNHTSGIANGMPAGLGEPVSWPPGHQEMTAAEWIAAVRRDAIMDKFIITKMEVRRGEK